MNCDSDDIIPSLLRDFSAPVKLDFTYSQQDLALLFASDTNAFNRWDAGQKLMTQILLDESSEIPKSNLAVLDKAVAAIVHDEKLDSALKALAVQLPELATLIGTAHAVNADALFAKHRQLKEHLGKILEPLWFSTFETTPGNSSGNRWLRNTALRYMMFGDAERHFELAANQQDHADNMTDELAALQVIANSNISIKSEYMNKFYDKWQEEELVMDKWFSAQALYDDEQTLPHVRKLLKHPKFSIENPNKVRSVVGAFVAGNLAQFHHSNGEGYEFLADIIIQLNRINPQIAAGLAKQFNQWRKFDSKRQALIQEQLGRIIATDNLSNDVFEVVDKSLKL